jgi:hypothetical protein
VVIQWRRGWKHRNPRWYEDWTRWFAWHPVRLDENRIVWLQTVERQDSRPLSDVIVWEYRLAEAAA